MSDAIAPQSSELEQLQQTLLSASSPKKQLAAIPKLIEAETPGHEILQAFLISRSPDIVAGAAYQALVQVETLPVQTFLAEKYPDGILSELPSEQNVDYRKLQLALSRQEFETADTITRQKLCEIAGPAAQKR
ncbi:MAG: GUN4 N-terminal ARM-like repeat domain-containing protein, partial [Cyanobacteria bacterium P01_H01_bin.15]